MTRGKVRFALVMVLAATGSLVPGGRAGAGSTELYPDLRTVVPQHLNVVNEHQREVLRFSNGIANVGGGPWQMRPAFPLDGFGTQDAVQEIVAADGSVVESKTVSRFEFHPAHNHWHINGVALFEIRLDAPDGPVFGGNSIKTTFCLIDWYALEGTSKTPKRTFFECNGETQGISPGWVDQYHQATKGQELDITGAPAGRIMYLVSTANHEGIFLEQDLENNAAWVSFLVVRDSKGNPKIELVDRSPCTGRLCGDQVPNR